MYFRQTFVYNGKICCGGMENCDKNMNIMNESQRMKFKNIYDKYMKMLDMKKLMWTKISRRIQIKLKETKSSEMKIFKI